MSAPTLRNVILSIGTITAMIGSGIGTALAEDDRGRHEQRDEREWQHRERWDRGREEHRYVPPPVVVVPPRREIYEPPPIVVEQPPSGINIILPITIR